MTAVAKARHNRALPTKNNVLIAPASSPVKTPRKGKDHRNTVRSPKKGQVHWNPQELGQPGQMGQAGVAIVDDDAAVGVAVLYCMRHLSDASSSNRDGT